MPLTIERFTERLTLSGVMSEGELREWLGKVPTAKRPRDGEELARELVKRKRLTAYQALEIYMGKGQTLVLGNYVVLDKIGEGGMGIVLKAEHRRMRRVVALKVMSSVALGTRGAMQRFEREVQAVSKLEHPNIVTAYDADQAGDTSFLVMQFVDGEDLSVIIKKSGPLPVDRAVDCVLQAARGLEFAHQNGVIHRDIKPHNLLLNKDGVVKILDMGLARIEDPLGANHESTLTSTGAVLGTIDYMSPEQAEDTRVADARSDIYSLGCTLFYLLTSRVPYPGDTAMKRLLGHREATIPSLVELVESENQKSQGLAFETVANRNLLVAVESVFRKMVAKRAVDRYASMTQVVAELQRCLTVPVARIASVLVPSEENKLNDFLTMISDPNVSESAVAARAGVSPENAATVQFRGEASDTDPTALTGVSAAARRRGKSQSWWHDPNKLAIVITAVVMLTFLGWLAVSSKWTAPPSSDENRKLDPKTGPRRFSSNQRSPVAV